MSLTNLADAFFDILNRIGLYPEYHGVRPGAVGYISYEDVAKYVDRVTEKMQR